MSRPLLGIAHATSIFALESVKFILKNNDCKLNSDFFQQTNGAIMCTLFPPTYAKLIMIFF